MMAQVQTFVKNCINSKPVVVFVKRYSGAHGQLGLHIESIIIRCLFCLQLLPILHQSYRCSQVCSYQWQSNDKSIINVILLAVKCLLCLRLIGISEYRHDRKSTRYEPYSRLFARANRSPNCPSGLHWRSVFRRLQWSHQRLWGVESHNFWTKTDGTVIFRR